MPIRTGRTVDLLVRRTATRLVRALRVRAAALHGAMSPLVVAAAMFALVDALWLAMHTRGAHTSLLAHLTSLPMTAVAAWAAWRAGNDPRLAATPRHGWRWIAAGAATYSASNVVWLLNDQVQHAGPVLWAADISVLACYPLILLGFHALLRRPGAPRRDGPRFWLDMGTVLLAAGAASWRLIIAPLVAHQSVGGSWLPALAAVAHPLGSVALLCGAMGPLLRGRRAGTEPARRIPLELAALAGLAIFVADLAVGYLALRPGGYVTGSWPHLAYTLAALLLVLGAEYDRRTARPLAEVSPPGWVASGRRRASAVPYVAVAIACGLLVHDVDRWTSTAAGLLLVAVVLTGLVVARQVLVVRDNGRLFERLAEREAHFHAIFEQSPIGILLVGRRGAVLDTNAAFQRMLGYSRDELLARRSDDLSPTSDAAAWREAVRTLRGGVTESVAFEMRYLRKTGEPVWASVTMARTETGGQAGLLAMVEDITARKRLEAELLDHAFHDALTGLANRALFRDRVQHALQRSARRGGGTVALLFLDLDGFRAINDSLGTEAGDELLAVTAARLREATRDSDTVARFGGDEFGVLLEQVATDADALLVADRILTTLRIPLTLRGRLVRAQASGGLLRARAGQSADELLRNADVAMYHAKQAGKGQVALFAPEMHAAVLDRLELEGDLRAAVEWQGDDEGELHVEYQPVVDLRTGTVRCYEALARWAHPGRGSVSPSAFIPVAEEAALIGPVGRWVLRTACRDAAGWADAPGVSVNLAAAQLRDPGIVEVVRAALRDAGLAPGRLTLEITESAVMRDVEGTLATMHGLKALGVRLAIDDVGTGYSSLGHLQRLPVDVLKIDKAFVDGVASEDGEVALARGVIALGTALGLRTVAEGVEHPEQAEALRRLGCDLAQG
ncbi:MAG: EAL domain-containing protein, partial [Gemmatirosa sp.]|nr:EAL domain-containing protein [Gemmatirosa sp.]